jgi:hypothetical protein
MAATDALKAALLAELATLCPVATNPVEYAQLALDIDEYCNAKQAAATLALNHLTSRSVAGQSYGYKDGGQAQRAALTMEAKLARAGLSLTAGATTNADMREEVYESD